MSRSWRVACAVSALTAALFAAGTPATASAEEVAFKPKAAGDIKNSAGGPTGLHTGAMAEIG